VEVGAVGLKRLEDEVATANDFIEYLSSCLLPKVRKNLELMASTRYLGWNDKKGKVGVLFPEHLVDMFPSDEREDTGAGKHEGAV